MDFLRPQTSKSPKPLMVHLLTCPLLNGIPSIPIRLSEIHRIEFLKILFSLIDTQLLMKCLPVRATEDMMILSNCEVNL